MFTIFIEAEGAGVMSKNQFAIGILFVAAGIFILLGKLGVFSFIGTNFWPLILILPGVFVHVLFFGRIVPSTILIPGAFLTVSGILFFICIATSWTNMQYLWPFFLFGIAIGVAEFYFFDEKMPKQALTLALILTFLTFLFFFVVAEINWGFYLLAVACVAFGVWILVKSVRSK
jgi:hypothetical protein